MNFLKFVVVFLGILLVAASIITLALVLQRGVKRPEKSHVAQDACPGGDIAIDRENGLKEFKMEGNRVLLHIQGRTGRDKIIIVDACAGKAVGAITLE